jgi:predicted nucleic acid-binding protein
VILDASVATKWFIPNEVLEPQAQQVRDEILDGLRRVTAPSIIWAEVAHAVVGAVRRRRLTSDDATLVSARFDLVRPLIELVDVEPADAVQRALEVGVGAYDAQYLILAGDRQMSLLTADRRLTERGREHGYDVVWLGELTRPAADTPQGYR